MKKEVLRARAWQRMISLDRSANEEDDMTLIEHLAAACAALALLTFTVGLRMLQVRIAEMKRRRIAPDALALSAQKSARLEDTRAADNFNHLFELPVLFYALCAVAISAGHVPGWLVVLAWIFVLLRSIHSIIQCSYNKVMHRFIAFLLGFFLLGGMWIVWLASLLMR